MPKTKPKYLAAIKSPIARALFEDGGALENVMLGNPDKDQPSSSSLVKSLEETTINAIDINEGATERSIKAMLIHLAMRNLLYKEEEGKFILYSITRSGDADLDSLAKAALADIPRIVEKIEKEKEPNPVEAVSSVREKDAVGTGDDSSESSEVESLPDDHEPIEEKERSAHEGEDVKPKETEPGEKKWNMINVKYDDGFISLPIGEEWTDNFFHYELDNHGRDFIVEKIDNNYFTSEESLSVLDSFEKILKASSTIEEIKKELDLLKENKFIHLQDAAGNKTELSNDDLDNTAKQTFAAVQFLHIYNSANENLQQLLMHDRLGVQKKLIDKGTPLEVDALMQDITKEAKNDDELRDNFSKAFKPLIPAEKITPEGNASMFAAPAETLSIEAAAEEPSNHILDTGMAGITRNEAKEIAENIKKTYDFMNTHSYEDATGENERELVDLLGNLHFPNRILRELMFDFDNDNSKDNYNKLKNAVVYLQKTAEQFTKSTGRLLGGEKRDIAEVEKASERLIEAAEREMGWKTRRGARPVFHIQQCEYQMDIINIIIGQLMQKSLPNTSEIDTLEKQRAALNHTIENIIKNAHTRKEVRRYAEHVESGNLPDTDQMNFILGKLSLPANRGAENPPGMARIDATTTNANKFAKGRELGESGYWIHKDTYYHINAASNEIPLEVKSAACTFDGKYTSFINYGNALTVLNDEQVFQMAAKFMLDAHSDAPDTRFKIKGDARFVKACLLFCECSNDNIPKPQTAHNIQITDADRKAMDKFLEKSESKEAITGSKNAVLSKNEEEKLRRKMPEIPGRGGILGRVVSHPLSSAS